ncbi:MAG: toll/interleukin-1 receptor domain-containing protein [Chitinophagaceae bacterium]
MQLLNQIVISRATHGNAVIQLLQGDLSAIPKEHAADLLVISAYPGSYVPVEKTLIAALFNKGINVAAMAKKKAIDLRDQLGCWLSEPLSAAEQQKFNFEKILCFEPNLQTAEHATAVGNIFRCINTFAFNENNNIIAMPVLASGKQRVPVEKMLPAMLDAGIFWLESGLPLTCIKLVVFSDDQAIEALPVFVRAKQQNEIKKSVHNGTITGTAALELFEKQQRQQLPGEETMAIVASEIKDLAQKDNTSQVVLPASSAAGPVVVTEKPGDASTRHVLPNEPPAGTPQYHCFVSYAHKHADVIDAFVKKLTAVNKDLQIFYDKSSIPPGGLWIKQISDAIQQSKKVLIFLSPDYSNSMVCWDEFQCAKLIEYNSKKQIIQTVYLYNDAAMPPIMGIYSWTDCREGDQEKLEKIVAQLVKELAPE